MQCARKGYQNWPQKIKIVKTIVVAMKLFWGYVNRGSRAGEKTRQQGQLSPSLFSD